MNDTVRVSFFTVGDFAEFFQAVAGNTVKKLLLYS